MRLQIFGTGCPNSKRLYRVTERAARELDLDYDLDRVEEIEVILSAGVLRTPALGVDGTLVVHGRVPTLEQVKGALLERAACSAKPSREPSGRAFTAGLQRAASLQG